MAFVNVGLIGCGTIGSALAQEMRQHWKGVARLIGIYDQDAEAAQQLAQRFRPTLRILPLQKLVARCDLVIEAASPKAVGQILPEAIKHRSSLLVMSTGGLLSHRRLFQRAVACSIPIYLPSGALVGIDGIKAAAVGKLRSVTLTTRKAPSAFSGAPGIAKRKINLNKIRRAQIIFQGSAAQAAALFPQNINVAATLALAGSGAKRTQVRLIADPSIRENIHEVEAVGQFGRCFMKTENRPSQENPKTSQLAVFSAVATLRQIFQPLKVGT